MEAAGARCGEVTVPLDYRDPGGRTISVAVARRAATDTADTLGTLVVNTCGGDPGAFVEYGQPGALITLDLSQPGPLGQGSTCLRRTR